VNLSQFSLRSILLLALLSSSCSHAPVSQEQDMVDRTVEYLVENNVLAAYEPLSNELMDVRENVDVFFRNVGG